ncbi:outer membrane protein [Lutibaculum baratangense]|nr:outer membrane protein [Lutibaculum baratangense]
MIKTMKLALAAAVAMGATAGAAGAADLWVPPMKGSVVEPVPVEFGSNWYLRGDVGYRAHMEDWKLQVGSTAIDLDDDSEDMWTVGAGAGYQFNPWLRADVTVDFAPEQELRGRIPFAREFVLKGDTNIWTVLANAYVDLGTWNRITPYVGAGVGASRVGVSDPGIEHTPTGVQATLQGSDHAWGLTWALMAGASVSLTPNLLADVGYRYLNIEEVNFDQDFELEIKDLAAHEVRVGVRYMMQ